MAKTISLFNKNFSVLFSVQALANISGPMIVLSGGIIGSKIAPSQALATLPISLFIVGIALSAAPAIFIMQKIGRKKGFICGQLLGSGAACLALFAVEREFFNIFCLACFFLGGQAAFLLQLRFAAAEVVSEERSSQAISILLLANVIAAFLGPEIASLCEKLFAELQYLALFLALAIIHLIGATPFLFYTDPSASVATSTAPEITLSTKDILFHADFYTALLASAVGFATMSYIMTAAPIQMHMHQDMSMDITARAIQMHLMAMFLPSLFTGKLIDRFGPHWIMIQGTILLLLCGLFGYLGQEEFHFFALLILLGLGWNCNFVAATALIASSFRQHNQFKVQAINDGILFSMQALASLAAGMALNYLGWQTLLLVSIPLLLLSLSNLILQLIYRSKKIGLESVG